MNISKMKSFDIVVEFEIEFNGNIFTSVSDILPIRLEDGTIDKVALDEYEDFVVNLWSLLDFLGYEELDVNDSIFSETSWYVATFKNTVSSKDNIEKIIFIRISDHEISEETRKQRKEYYKREAERLKQPKEKDKQKWRFKNIVVNGERYSSYDDALDDLEKRIKSWT